MGFSVRLEFSLKQNDQLPLKLLSNVLNCGSLSQYHTGVWCYKSTGFKTAFYVINYFDKYHLFAQKYKNYIRFRKVYILVTQGKHLDAKGIEKIRSIIKKGSPETERKK